MLHGFDGSGPGTIEVAQDVVLPFTALNVEFDYRAGWDMFNFGGSTLPRTFVVAIEPTGGGAPLASQLILTAPPATINLDTGPLSGTVNVNLFAGQAVRVVFRWSIPENFTGPAFFQLDNVTLSQSVCATINNCSFETGAFPAWIPTDLATPFVPLHVGGAGESPGFGLFASAPTEGSFAVLHGFDGSGPGTIEVAQDVVLPSTALSVDFDFRAGWDMFNFGGSTLPRTFRVDIEPSGGGAPLASQLIFSAQPATIILDTGPTSAHVRVDAFAGQAVRVVFRWSIPETFTGPAFFQLDNVTLTQALCATVNNCSFETGAFPAWIPTDLATPFVALHVGGPGESPGFGLFASAPTEGSFAVLHGFDGAGPGAIEVAQDLTVPATATRLDFEYRAGWDMFNFAGSTLPRTFVVAIEPPGGGDPFVSRSILSAPPATVTLDTGNLVGSILVGGFAGQAVRIVFRWSIPEFFTGPAFFQLDMVSFNSATVGVPLAGGSSGSLALSEAIPNPSRGAALFRLSLPGASDVSFEIFDVTGRCIWTERESGLAPGEHQLSWHGRDLDGSPSPAGVYYVRLLAAGKSLTRRFVHVK